MSREYYDDYRHGASRKRRKSLPGSVFNGVMLILSVATGAAMIVTLLAPFVHPGRTWIFPVLGLVAPAVYVITLLVTLYWIIRWRWRIALPLVVLLLAGLFKVPLFLKPELRRHYGEETSFGRGAITLLTFNVRSFYNDRGQWSFDGVTEVIRRVNPDIVCLQEFNRTSSKAEELDSLLSDYDRTVVMEGNRRDPVFPLALYTKYRILGKSHSILGPMKQDGQSVWVDLLVGDDTIRIFNNPCIRPQLPCMTISIFRSISFLRIPLAERKSRISSAGSATTACCGRHRRTRSLGRSLRLRAVRSFAVTLTIRLCPIPIG